jgi:hypothetical protein
MTLTRYNRARKLLRITTVVTHLFCHELIHGGLLDVLDYLSYSAGALLMLLYHGLANRNS